MSVIEKIKKLAKENAENAIRQRRHLHQNPELSFCEFETAKFIASELRALGLEPTEGVAGTGLIALIEGKNPAKKNDCLKSRYRCIAYFRAK